MEQVIRQIGSKAKRKWDDENFIYLLASLIVVSDKDDPSDVGVLLVFVSQSDPSDVQTVYTYNFDGRWEWVEDA